MRFLFWPLVILTVALAIVLSPLLLLFLVIFKIKQNADLKKILLPAKKAIRE